MTTIVKNNSSPEFFTQENCFITEIFNLPELSTFSIARARVAPGVTTELHTLLDTDEMYFILSGSGEMETGGIIQGVVSTGDAVFIPRNTTQRIKNLSGSDLIFLCICTPPFETKNYR
jgi:mannose-6-phosphate isomerase-like protein (cupin superfamily)